ncbi:diaminobutyrate acetyltransferase [Nesterenkonia flava]|uniref:L-2,4-diaminobutyric acid acetyltransferase n=1 Tax=Nesterenkonia flava TaxID=469799 RepID=A0ABU1FW58_9MICC|nr:diaminobutyrate acetyltransferase [Nesterenkonia flava]MDR5712918.1 diaminobutyrate acetyltransferase [Nesterenkonia flava]
MNSAEETPAQNPPTETITLTPPTVAQGADLWRLAQGTGVLDTNTPYAYLLWARDFAETSVIAQVDGEPAGFISGYLTPRDPRTLFIWQVAVDSRFRGRGLAKKMLFELVQRTGAERLETTITADNEASIALFTALAREHGTQLRREPLFTTDLFPAREETGEDHAAEDLYTVEPLTHGGSGAV